MKPQNFEEAVVWYYIISTLILYMAGSLFVLGPALAWLLTFYLLWKLWRQTEATPEADRIRIPIMVWVWIASMLVMGLALVVGHLEMGYGLVRIVKSFINFFLRTWALLALFPLIGCLNIRPQVIYRAVCILCLQCLIVMPVSYALLSAGIDFPDYTVSLMAKIGGNATRFYHVSFIFLQEGTFRLTLFASWAPAIAFVGNIFFWLANQDSNQKWRWIGMISSAAMIWGSASRLGLVCLFAVPILQFFLLRITQPLTQLTLGISSFVAGLFSVQLITWLEDFKNYFDSQRANSSRVRSTLERMALYRWQEAPIWGHGIKAESGPAVTNFMPVGSHHTWLGLLYVHGIVGFIALVIPMLFSFITLLIKAQKDKIAQTGLTILFILFIFSFGENLETLAYLYWPGLIMIGIAFKQPFPALFTHSKPKFSQSQLS